MKNIDLNRIRKINDLSEWYINANADYINEYNSVEYYSYTYKYCDEMYDLVLLLNFSGFNVDTILKWSREGKLVIRLENAKSIINTIKKENIDKYNELVDTLNSDINTKTKPNIKKLHMAS